MTHDFVISSENVNEYGYRILTDGIDYKQYMRNPVVLFMHEREYEKSGKDKGKAVIGRCLKIYKEGTELKATIEFDMEDDFARTIEGKVARGFIRMASIYADPKETSSEPELIEKGQSLETVTKCKLVEISIVDIGGNDDALKLSKYGVNKLKKITENTNLNMSNFKTIALALGIVEDSNETNVLKQINDLKLAKETAEKQVNSLTKEINGIKLSEATSLVEKAIVLNLLPESLKATQIKAFEADFAAQKVILTKLVEDAEKAAGTNFTQSKIKEVVLSGKGTGSIASEDAKDSFDYMQKHDPVKLSKIREESPEKYKQLAKDYASGVRYKQSK